MAWHWADNKSSPKPWWWPRYVMLCIWWPWVNTLRSRRNGQHFADNIFKRIFFSVVQILIKISLKFVPKGPINNILALVQVMAWRCPGNKPLSEPMLVSLLTHVYVTRPQWVNTSGPEQYGHYFADSICNCIFLNECNYILIQISLKFIHKCLVYKKTALV